MYSKRWVLKRMGNKEIIGMEEGLPKNLKGKINKISSLPAQDPKIIGSFPRSGNS